jgi:hypothetical protein
MKIGNLEVMDYGAVAGFTFLLFRLEAPLYKNQKGVLIFINRILKTKGNA